MISIGIYSMIPPARQEIKSISRIGIWWTLLRVAVFRESDLFSALVEVSNPGLARAILSLEIIGLAVLCHSVFESCAYYATNCGIFTIILWEP
jgi:hypothetical protein